MRPEDVAELTGEEQQLLALCHRERKAKTGTVRATKTQLAERLGWDHGALDERLAILVEVEAVAVDIGGRITMPATTADLVASHPDLREIATRLAASRAPAHARARGTSAVYDSGASGSSPIPPYGGLGEHTLPPSSSAEGRLQKLPEGPRRRGSRNWTPHDLAGYFRTRTLQFAPRFDVPPGTTNLKALRGQFRAWQGEGLTAEEIRDLIDHFAAHLGKFSSPGIPVWKSFLSRRAQVWADLKNATPQSYDETVDTNSEWRLDTE